MAPEQRIAQLEAELAEARADLRRLTETMRVMIEAQAKERAAEAQAKATRRERNLRYRAKTSHETVCETSRKTHAEASSNPSPSSSPPPSFSLSPPSKPSPSILYPFSPASPPPPSEKPSVVAAAPTEVSGQASLLPEAKAPEKPARKQPDGEHHALWKALADEYQRVMGHAYASGNAGADASAVKWLRETAKASPEDAVRRWSRLLEWSKGGFPSVTGFAALRQHWNAPQVLGAVRPKSTQAPAAPSNWDTLEVLS